VNSKGAILEATIEYIYSLRKDQQKMLEMTSRVEQLESQERKLLLQREVFIASELHDTVMEILNTGHIVCILLSKCLILFAFVVCSLERLMKIR